MDPCGDFVDHIFSELARIDLRLVLAVARARASKTGDERFDGLIVSDATVDALLSDPPGLPRWARAELADPRHAHAIALVDAAAAQREAASLAAGAELPLTELRRMAELSPTDVLFVLACLAPEIDLRYEKLFGYLHDDVTRKRPSVDLLLNLCCGTIADKIAARDRFSDAAPLIKRLIVTLDDEPDGRGAPLLARQVRLDPRIAAFLLGNDLVDPVIAPIARVLPAGGNGLPSPIAGNGVPAPIAGNGVSAPVAGHASLVAWIPTGACGVVSLEGPAGTGKKTWAGAACAQRGLPVLVIDGEAAAATPAGRFPELARRCVREAMLRRAALVWDGLDPLLTPGRRADRAALFAALAESPVIAFLCSAGSWDPGRAFAPRPFARVSIPRPDAAARLELWTAFLGPDAPGLSTALPEIASHYRFTPGQIGEAVETARNRARAHGRAAVALDDLRDGCRARDPGGLAGLARRVPPRRAWDDLIVPSSTKAQLRELTSQVRHRTRVMSSWGFDHKLASGKGTAALFSGPSGTGKTMAAAIIAGELGLDLHKIDLSAVVNKYIGETEKNLRRVFEAGADANAILFFDEADALFGKRSEVKDAHDRYANIETGYLLQQMEEYEGVSILATNLRRNMDDAFVRRLSFAVTFPMPDEADRLRLWRTLWPPEAPRHPDIDDAFLARHFKLSGGNIRNAVLAAAFLAAARNDTIAMVDVVWAVHRELEKLGMTTAPSQFGPYAGVLVAGTPSVLAAKC